MGQPSDDRSLEREDARAGLATDLYELTMAGAYEALGMRGVATFSLTTRSLPEDRAFLIAAGLERALRRLAHMGFDARAVDYLVEAGYLDRRAAEAIAQARFTGDVWAVREGRAVFAHEPVLEVDAPIAEAQLVETALLNAVHFPTTVATKAARCVAAARGRALVEFGTRRTAGIEAALEVARACWLVGFDGTSNVLAGLTYGIPLRGTVAHSFIEAFSTEREAFEAWGHLAHGPITLLVDTYDTLRGVGQAIHVAHELRAGGKRVVAIRLDSGDLDALSRKARQMLDDADLREVRIVASGGLDERAIDALVRAQAPIDAFGVGTRIGVSADAPVLDMAYKLVSYDGRPCLKLSEKKATLVGPKQVWRRRGTDARYVEDRICARDEPAPGDDWEPLLEKVVEGGRVLARPSLDELRERHAEEIRALPPDLLAVEAPGRYPVALSAALESRQGDAVADVRRRNAG